MAIQFYKTQQGNYALDKATGKALPVSTIPSGSAVITWSGSSLPSELQNALTVSSAPSPTPTPSVSDNGKAQGIIQQMTGRNSLNELDNAQIPRVIAEIQRQIPGWQPPNITSRTGEVIYGSPSPTPTPQPLKGYYAEFSNGFYTVYDSNKKPVASFSQSNAGEFLPQYGLSANNLGSPQPSSQVLPDTAHKNDAIFAELMRTTKATADDKKIMEEGYKIISKNDSDKALQLAQNFNFALEFSDPIFKAKAAIVIDALKQGLASTSGDLAFRETQLSNTLKDLQANTEATKGQLDFQHTQELEKLAKSYQQDLLTTRDNMAMVGKTSSSVRARAEQLLGEQNTGLVESSNKQFTYQTGVQSRNLASAERNLPLELAQLRDEAKQKRIADLRRAETDLGSYGLSNLGFAGADVLGDVPSGLGNQKIKDALSFANFVF